MRQCTAKPMNAHSWNGCAAISPDLRSPMSGLPEIELAMLCCS